MEQEPFFTEREKRLFFAKYRQLLRVLYSFSEKEDVRKIREWLRRSVAADCFGRDKNGINGLLRNVDTALIAACEIGLKRTPIIALLLYRPVLKNLFTAEEVEAQFGGDTAQIIRRLLKTSGLYARNTAVDSGNFHHLLFTFAEDVRVILLMIADRLFMMRMGKELADDNDRRRLAHEASYLYAPLAHRLGLYAIKGELEDLSLKYTDPAQFNWIKEKLSETKRSRDAYMEEFIRPVQRRLAEEGFAFDIKGRTKSIHSINNKLKKQQIEFENIFDLFAVRIILDLPDTATQEQERSECWRVFSIITNLCQSNPERMRDWISIPKSNGYESLHITVMGPQSRWVEVQIRTRRMDAIAERGLAAHWKYKGIKEDAGLDGLLASVRMALESKDTDPQDLMRNFSMDLYRDEIYVFTPQGKPVKLPKGATVLDFAFAVHTGLGSKCVSGTVNGKNVPIRHTLANGDTVLIKTSPAQSPKSGWLAFVATSKARIKIKQALREEAAKTADFAKELLHRRFKNRKIEADEGRLMRYIKKKGYKTVTDFYLDISNERIDPNQVIEDYLELERREKETPEAGEVRSAESFVTTTEIEEISARQDVLVIDKNLTGVDYSLAKCCNPIFGDEIFAFVSTQGIKIHRKHCPNEPEMRARFGYRIIDARWSGKGKNDYVVNLLVTGRDDITIVSNITSVIGKENGVALRSLVIDSTDGFFQGNFGVLVKDTLSLNQLIKKIKRAKGVTSIVRLGGSQPSAPSVRPSGA